MNLLFLGFCSFCSVTVLTFVDLSAFNFPSMNYDDFDGVPIRRKLHFVPKSRFGLLSETCRTNDNTYYLVSFCGESENLTFHLYY